MLANLGLYGKVFAELQSQIEKARRSIVSARRNAPAANQRLARRGEKLIEQISSIVRQTGVPTSRQFDQQLDRLRKAVKDLRRGPR